MALLGSTVTTFAVSALLNDGKFSAVDVQVRNDDVRIWSRLTPTRKDLSRRSTCRGFGRMAMCVSCEDLVSFSKNTTWKELSRRS